MKFRLDHSSAEGRTRGAIVELLLEAGPITATQIGERLGISAAGVRRHLDALIAAGDAEATLSQPGQPPGRGRPPKGYLLTAAGRAKLGHTYDDLAVAAMSRLREIGGEDAVRAFARQRIDDILAEVAADSADVETKARQIAAALTEAGYAASTEPVVGRSQAIQICQHHCPVSHVAEEFPELCETELEAMSQVLGTRVQRLATIVNGNCACTTHVPVSPASH